MSKKFFVALWIMFLTCMANAKCPNTSSGKEAIIFLDLNKNRKEIEVARSAACKRGEYLIVLPEGPSKHFDMRELEREANLAKDKGVKINSFIISGHDGGGDFGGENGSLLKSDLVEFSKNHPEVQESVSSLLLLGCYTGVKKEIYDWKEMFPRANLIAGYEGQAPLGDKPAGHSYIEGLLLREKNLNQARNRKEIEDILRRGIKHINLISAALYYRPSCESGMDTDQAFYFRPMGGKSGFSEFSSLECERIKKGDGIKYREQFLEYYRGHKPIPEKTNGTELRSIYNFFRVNEHCFEGDPSFPSTQKVFFTLFFNDAKKNFGEYYNGRGYFDQFNEALDSIKNNFDSDFDNYLDEQQGMLDFVRQRGSLFKEPLSEEIADIQNQNDEIMTTLRNKHQFSPYVKVDKNTLAPEVRELYSKLTTNSKYLSLLYSSFEREDYSEEDNDGVPNFVGSYLSNISGEISSKISNKDRTKREILDQINSIERPTPEFFEKASRQEILRHSHKINELVSNDYIRSKGLHHQFYRQILEDQMGSLNCLPFEWHEMTARSSQTHPECSSYSSDTDRFLRD